MVRKILSVSFLCLSLIIFSQIAVTKITTDYKNYWESSNATPNPDKPNVSNNLLSFTWKGVNYSTGVSDATLTAKGQIFTSKIFKAFAGNIGTGSASSNTFIGVGKNFGGAGNVSPVPVVNDLVKYITDGKNGLDLGTAIFNFPSSGQLKYDITSINPMSINDSIPDVILTQMGSISNVQDQYFFVDKDNNIVGKKYLVNYNSIADVGNADWKFYNATDNPPTYNTNVSNNGSRQIRLLAFDWSELGLTVDNITRVTKFVQVFSGESDTAFTAYNATSITLKTSVSGILFNDNDSNIPNGNGYAGATILLKSTSGTIISTAVTSSNGNFLFPNVSGGNYTVELQVPTGYEVVGNVNSTKSNMLSISVVNDPISDQNFGINLPPIAKDDGLTTQFNTIISVNILSNDVDPNSGSLVPSSINLVAPPNVIDVMTTNGNVKGFSVVGQGMWLVDNAGLFTFTPTKGFSGNASNVRYTVKDIASLTSNLATISVKVEEFCYKPAATAGATLDTNHGISNLGRAGVNADNWPMVRKGAWTALEAKTKGFVINRILTTTAVDEISNPVEGMMVYDKEAKCLKIFTTTDNSVTFGWKCFTKQTCPNN